MFITRAAAFVVLAAAIVACSGDAGPSSTPDLRIERTIGYAVAIDESNDTIQIGLSDDRDAVGGKIYDVTQAVWRNEDGPWNLPPASCLVIGRRVELGVSQVQDEARPGLLMDRVIWLSCLAPADD